MTLITPENSVREDQASIHSNSKTDQRSTKPDEPSPPSHPSKSQPPCEEKKITCNIKRDSIDKVTLALEGFGLFVLLVYAIATIAIWRATNDSAKAGIRSANATRDAMKADQRAWVGADSPPQVLVRSLEHGKFRASIALVTRNFGKGPALKVMTDQRIVTSGHLDENVQSSCDLIFPFVGLKPSRQVVLSDENAFRRQWGHVIFPNQTLSNVAEYGDDSLDLIGKEAYVIGCIVYRDQFSDPHWTKFCYNTGDFATDVVRDASSFGRLYACNTNNYTDDIEKK
jgi:hypothetical protein